METNHNKWGYTAEEIIAEDAQRKQNSRSDNPESVSFYNNEEENTEDIDYEEIDDDE